MSKKAWIIFGAICAAILAGLIFLSNRDRVDVGTIDTNAIQTPSQASGNIGDHVFGKADSKVRLIEYGDFQCPGCGGAHPTVKKLTEKYKDQIAFVFRNFPIASKHPNARAAAAAAEAAGLQGKYWEMHNLIFENQSSWEGLGTNDRGKFFNEYAKQLSLDEGKFKSDMESAAINQKISFDQAVGKKAGAEVTPTFILNGKKMTDDAWRTDEAFENTLKDAMKAEGIQIP